MILEEFPKYDITQDGKVISLNYNNTGKPKEMSQRLNKFGYMQIGITNKDGKRKFMQVHRLVAMAFVDNADNKPEVNHVDGNKTNNVSSNLEWCTSSENQRHAFDTGLNKAHKSNVNGNYQGEKCIHSKLTEQDVIDIRKRHKNGERTKDMAVEYGISKNSLDLAVSRKARMRTWKHVPYPEEV